jgi:hypothetical protein
MVYAYMRSSIFRGLKKSYVYIERMGLIFAKYYNDTTDTDPSKLPVSFQGKEVHLDKIHDSELPLGPVLHLRYMYINSTPYIQITYGFDDTLHFYNEGSTLYIDIKGESNGPGTILQQIRLDDSIKRIKIISDQDRYRHKMATLSAFRD